ncbi:MAG: hypothetical protein H0X24_06580 [Ktedonobacterales bacterium]|nr:hypothetical protein [Ktedonobacteraceae bacterium]MBA3823559.1 hypothetical protein [Ktedonobacterales bacterium]
MLAWPDDEQALIKSLALGSEHYPQAVSSVELIGSNESLVWTQDDDGVHVRLPTKNKLVS